MVALAAHELTSEMIGRVRHNLYRVPLTRTTVDRTQTDYKFWDRLRRGKAKGFELGGLFAKPIGRILSGWTLGKGFSYSHEDEDTNTLLADFLRANMRAIIDAYYDSLTLGDAYLVVNPDGSLTAVPPNQMEVITDDLDYRQIVGYKITTVLENGTRIEDEYRADRRIVRVYRGGGDGNPEEIEFENIIGRIPVIHFANERSANEIYGHPTYEALYTLFAEYDDTIRKALDGVKIMGNPIPVVEGADDPQGEIDRLKSKDDTTYTNPASPHEQTRPTIDLNATAGEMFVLGKGASFNFKAPGVFTQDSGRMLEYLFLLMLQHSQIPEWAWGGAIASSKASVDAQLPAFTLTIETLRQEVEAQLIALGEIFLAYRSFVVPGIETEGVTLQWSPLTDRDEQTTRAWVEFLFGRGLITQQTAVEASGLVEDVQAEVQAAADEMAAQRDQFEARIQEEMAQADGS